MDVTKEGRSKNRADRAQNIQDLEPSSHEEEEEKNLLEFSPPSPMDDQSNGEPPVQNEEAQENVEVRSQSVSQTKRTNSDIIKEAETAETQRLALMDLY